MLHAHIRSLWNRGNTCVLSVVEIAVIPFKGYKQIDCCLIANLNDYGSPFLKLNPCSRQILSGVGIVQPSVRAEALHYIPRRQSSVLPDGASHRRRAVVRNLRVFQRARLRWAT